MALKKWTFGTPMGEQLIDQNNNIDAVDKFLSKLNPDGVGSITWADLAQDVKENITGGNTAVVGVDSVSTVNIVDESVTPEKTSFIVKSKNIFNKNNLISGQFVNQTDGTLVSSASHSYLDFFKIKPNQDYSVSAESITGFRIAFYDEEKAFISGSVGQKSIKSPSTAYYARVSIFSNYASTTQIEEGVSVTEYEPYYLKLKGIEVDVPTKETEATSIDIVESEIVGSDNRLHTISSGYYWNGAHNASTNINHSDKISVKAGEVITLQYGTKDVTAQRVIGTIRFLDAYRKDGTVFESKTNLTSYVVPDGVTEIIVAASKSYLDSNINSAIVNSAIVIPYDDYTEPVAKQFIKAKDIKNTVHVYLPKEIPVAIGRTVELYHDLVCLEAKKYHFEWKSIVGIGYKNKFSITGNKEGSYPLTLIIYDDYMNVVYRGFSTIKISSNKIASTLNIIPIGDSLTNSKPWLQEVQTLSDDKIRFIGTRGKSDQTIRHEGRSGWDSKLYNMEFTHDFEATYQGNPDVSYSSNPFWNGSKFSLKHYVETQSAFVGTPDAVQIYLGTNGLQLDNTENVSYIKQMVDNIRIEYPTMPIFVCNTIYRSNQNGYYSTKSDGYVTSSSGFEFEEDIKIMDLQTKVYDIFSGMPNVFIIPLSVTMDRDNNFGQIEVQVNPRNTTKITIPSEAVHPQEPGYLQMADVMYSSYVNHLI